MKRDVCISSLGWEGKCWKTPQQVTIPGPKDVLPESCGRWKVETPEDHVGHPTAPDRKNVTHCLGGDVSPIRGDLIFDGENYGQNVGKKKMTKWAKAHQCSCPAVNDGEAEPRSAITILHQSSSSIIWMIAYQVCTRNLTCRTRNITKWC